MDEKRGIWFRYLCGDPLAHWHDHLGGGRYAGVSRCGNKRQDPQDIARCAQQRAEGRVEVGMSAQCRRCLDLVVTDRARWRAQALNHRRAQMTAWADDAAVAEERHGAARDACLERIDPESARWDVVHKTALAKAAWESGWDAAVAALCGAKSESEAL